MLSEFPHEELRFAEAGATGCCRSCLLKTRFVAPRKCSIVELQKMQRLQVIRKQTHEKPALHVATGPTQPFLSSQLKVELTASARQPRLQDSPNPTKYCLQVPKEYPGRAEAPLAPFCWVAVKEFSLNYHHNMDIQ